MSSDNDSKSCHSEEGEVATFEETLFQMISEYFRDHDYLTREALPQFLDFLGLSQQWESKDEQECLWKTFERYSKNDKVDEKGVKSGFGDFLSSQPEEEVTRMSRMSRASINITNNLINKLDTMKKKETEVIAEEPIEGEKVEIEHDKNYDKFINEIDPELLRKYYAAFVIMDIANKDILNYSELDGFTGMYSFYKLTFDDIVEFILYFGENDPSLKLFKLNKFKFAQISKEMKTIIQAYKDTFENVSFSGGSPQKSNDIDYFGDPQTVFNRVVDDIVLIERECEAYANLISNENTSNQFFVYEIIFLCHQRQLKLDSLRILFSRSVSQFQEMQEEYRQLNQKLIDTQTDENNEEQIDQLLNEIALLKEEKDSKYSEIEKLKDEIMTKESEMQALRNTMHQMELYEESQSKEIASLKLEISELKKKYESNITKVLEKIKVDNDKFEKQSMKMQKQPFFPQSDTKTVNKEQIIGGEFDNISGYSLGDLDDERKGENVKIKKMSYEKLMNYSMKVDMDNQDLIKKVNMLEEKIRDMTRKLDLANKNYEDTLNENSIIKSENIKLQSKVDNLSKEVEMNNMFRPSNAFNLSSRISRISNAQPMNTLHCQISNIKATNTSSSAIKTVTFTGSSMKNILQDEEEEQANDSNDLGSLEVSSGGAFFSAKKEEPILEEENEEIEQGHGDSNLFGKKEPQSCKASQSKSISLSINNQRRLNNISNSKVNNSSGSQFKAFNPNKISKEIEIGDDDDLNSSEHKSESKKILSQLDDFDKAKKAIYSSGKKKKISNEKTLTNAINSAKISNPNNIQVSSFNQKKENNEIIAEEDGEDDEEVKIESIIKRPRSLSPVKIQPSNTNSSNLIQNKDYFNIKNFGNLTATVQYTKKPMFPKKKSSSPLTRTSYDFMFIKHLNDINGILENNPQGYASYDIFSDLVYHLDIFKYKRTKRELVTTGDVIYLIDPANHTKFISFTGIKEIILEDKNCNVLTFKFHKDQDLSIETFRRGVLINYFQTRERKNGEPPIRCVFKDLYYGKILNAEGLLTYNEALFKNLPVYPDFDDAIKVGYLYKRGDYKQFTERFVVLFDIGLVYYDTEEPIKIKDLITLTNCSIFEVPFERYKKANAFEIINVNNKKYVFYAKKIEELISWKEAILKVIKKYGDKMIRVDVKGKEQQKK